MPRIEPNEKSELRRRPTTLDREQLEYTISKILIYGTLIFATLGGCASLAYLVAQQLKK